MTKSHHRLPPIKPYEISLTTKKILVNQQCLKYYGINIAILDAWMEVPLTTGEKSDLTALVDSIDAESSFARKLSRAIEVGDVLGLAESFTIGYQTRAELKGKLGF